MRAIMRLAFVVLSVTVSLGLWSCKSEGDAPLQAPSKLSYPSPAVVNAGSAVSGLTPTVTGTVSGYTVAPALPAGLSLAAASGAITGTPTEGAAEAAYTITASNSAGSTSFALRLAVAEGPVSEVKDTGASSPPVLLLSNTAPASGETLTVSVDVAGASKIVLSLSGSGCGALAGQSVNGPSLRQTAAVADAGRCVLRAGVTTAAGTVFQANQFSVVATRLPAVASSLSFKGGSYFPSGDVSFLPASATLTITSATAPQSFINGGTGAILITPSAAAGVTTAVATLSGIPGYFMVPVSPAGNGALRIDLSVAQDFFKAVQQARSAPIRMAPRAAHIGAAPAGRGKPKSGIGNRRAAADAATSSVTLGLRLLDPGGGASPPFSLPLMFQEVGSGPIQVSLSWGQPVDVDLHLVTAGSEEIYYGSRSDSTGGSLDLDSNAGCSIDNVDNENIVWPASTSPAAGQYIVRVDYFDACQITAAVPFTVRVTNCGATSTFSGSFTPGDADGGSTGSGVTVTTFDYKPCSGLSVQGKASYDDYVPTVAGLGPDPRSLPIRHAVVEVHKASDDSLLEVGTTDESGNYAIPFSMDTPAPYYTEVVAANNDDNLRERVIDTAGKLYSGKSDPVDAAMKPNATNININVTREKFGGAFNIFDLGVNAFNEVRARTRTTLPMLSWRWKPGVPTCGGTASCYHKEDDSIFVLATASDSDEYDDTVLAHEFGHFFIERLSKESSPGGDHGSATQVVPTLAWSEGVATWFGQTMLDTPTYIDTRASGAAVRLIETPEDDVPTGTDDDTLTGNISEAVVRAVLWDLSDSGEDTRTEGGVTVKDAIANPQGVFSTLTTLKTKTHDRAAAGVDLTDFLDQWLCSNLSTFEANAGDNFHGLVTVLNQFPFTPQQPASCN